jgi:chromosomal replication initiator protein
VLRTQTDKNVLYVSSEHFTNQFIDAIGNGSASEFTNFYQNVDVLIVDDIQFFEGKKQTQEIFFNIFNYLHMQNKQLIFTCDRAPKDLSGMQERLISRFKWGLSADLQVPSLETRMAIIQQKMCKDGIELPHNVTEYLSYSVRSNIRELEGVLISLIAEAALNQREIDMDLAKEVISKFVEHVSNEISIEFIQKIVASHYNIPVEQLKDKTRKKLIVTARKLSMYLAKQLSDKSLVNIGEYFGNRDHSTVIHAIKSIEEMLQKDDRFKNVVNDLTKKIKTSTGF